MVPSAVPAARVWSGWISDTTSQAWCVCVLCVLREVLMHVLSGGAWKPRQRSRLLQGHAASSATTDDECTAAVADHTDLLTIGPQPQAWPAMKTHTTTSSPTTTSCDRLRPPPGDRCVVMSTVIATSASIIWKEASTSQNLRPRLCV